MMYISASQHQPNTVYDEVKEFLEVDLEIVHAAISFVSSDTEATMMSWNQVQRATQADGTLLRLMDHIQMDMADSGLKLDKDLREFHRSRHDLHVVSSVLCYRDKIVIPTVLRGKVLTGIMQHTKVYLGCLGE